VLVEDHLILIEFVKIVSSKDTTNRSSSITSTLSIMSIWQLAIVRAPHRASRSDARAARGVNRDRRLREIRFNDEGIGDDAYIGAESDELHSEFLVSTSPG
jgi:hypothetical protein